MQYKKIVILANSRKHAGRCLAGREIIGQYYAGWIRPVSERSGEEVSEYERQYDDGSDPQILDIVDVPLIKAKPHACQTENWLISPDDCWIRAGALNWNQARDLAENPPTLWINGDSTYHGLNDQIAQNLAIKFTSSICLIHVDSVEIHVLNPGAAFGNSKRRVQSRFTFNGINYRIWVTDPRIERKYLAGTAVVTALGECLIAVSLAEPHEKKPGEFYHYKLAAAIIQRI
jgi:hypothetical protein